ncbi:hypothetical protein [Yersinia phage MHG19]|nr:hypothetical protein [Yersinia phage MHG19]
METNQIVGLALWATLFVPCFVFFIRGIFGK